MNDPAMEYAELRARIQAFKNSLSAMTDEELFETLHLIERERLDAKIGAGAGESEELLQKERNAEAEISRRHPDEMLRVYENWLKTRL